jgi:hypothetical protein
MSIHLSGKTKQKKLKISTTKLKIAGYEKKALYRIKI